MTKISKITTKVKYIELKTPFKTALRETSHAEFVRVYIEDGSGRVGIGEAPATKAITGEDIEDILLSIRSLKEQFLNRTCRDALELLHSVCFIGSSAKAALDIAFISLYLKQTEQTFFEYLDIKDTAPIKTDVTISLNFADIMLDDAKKAYEEGKDILKVKVGKDIKHAADVVKKISNKLPSSKILLDANQAWDLQDSLRFIKSVREERVELIEQPVIASDLESLKTITEISHIPILADEAVFTLDDAKRVVEQKCADMINVKLMKCGGVLKAVEILEYARQNGIKCMIGSMIEGPHSINAAIYLAFAYRDVIKHVDLDSPLLYKELPSEIDFEFQGCKIFFKK